MGVDWEVNTSAQILLSFTYRVLKLDSQDPRWKENQLREIEKNYVETFKLANYVESDDELSHPSPSMKRD